MHYFVLKISSTRVTKNLMTKKVRRTSKLWQILVQLIVVHKQNVSWYKPVGA